MKIRYSFVAIMVLGLSFCFTHESTAASKPKKASATTATKTTVNVEPFGGFKWDDTPDIILNKLKAIGTISGIETMKAVPDGNEVTYLDKSGNKFRIDDTFFGYKADGILINGVPFNIQITLRQNPGVMIASDNVPINKDNSLYQSHYLHSIELFSKSPQLIDKSKAICSNLKNKYGSSIRLSEKNGCEGTEGVLGGKSIDIACNHPVDYGCIIKYSNSRRNEELTEIYTKHLSNIEKLQNKGKADMGSSL